MAISTAAFYSAHQLRGDPFAEIDAGRERELLPSYFVRCADFEALVGDPSRPQSLILFAPRGHGKTSHRVELARRAREHPEHPALTIELVDFTGSWEQQPGRSLLEQHYLPLIRRHTLSALGEVLRLYPQRTAAFRNDWQAVARFAALVELFAPLVTVTGGKRELSRSYVEAYRNSRLGVRDWLLELSAMARQAGYAGIYCLIDGVDESEFTQQPEQALAVLRPLLDAPGILQECGFGFKFFLPDFFEPLMRHMGVGRLDRIPIYRLQWSESDLRAILAQRLRWYSRLSPTSDTSYLTRFHDLCGSGRGRGELESDTLIIAAAEQSPRQLLTIARDIVEAHCRQCDDPTASIPLETVGRVVGHYAPALALAALGDPAEPATPAPPHRAPPAAEPPHAPPLSFVSNGDIYLGDHLVNPDGLPKLLHQLMHLLWDERSRIVGYDELLEALYGNDPELRGSSRNNLAKLVQRLRVEIEGKGASGSRTYIDIVDGVGVRLRNFNGDVAG